MSKKPIDRFSLRYSALKLYMMLVNRLFYRKMQAKFRNRIPRDRPVLFAPNHQNALMDAMAPHMTSRRQPVFLTRGDIFEKDLMRNLFRLFKMLPVYRMRDGVSELARNEEIFQESIEVLKRMKSPVAIMPEGNHGDKRILRPLVKGIFRIAFQAQEDFGEKPGVVIVPIGIDYSKYSNFRGNMFIQYGEPIEVYEYYAEYKENQARALNSIRERLATEMRKYMIDIQSEEHYDTYMLLRQTYNRRMRERLGFRKKDLYHRLLADQHMIREISKVEKENPEEMSKLTEMGREYSEGVNKFGMRDWVFSRNRYSLIALILADLGMLALLPAFIFGMITNYLPYWITAKIGGKIADTQFQSTFKFVLGFVLFPVFYLILFILAWIFTDPDWIKWAFLVSMPVIGLMAYTWGIWFIKLRSLWKYQIMTLAGNKKLGELKELRKNIIVLTESMISEPVSASF